MMNKNPDDFSPEEKIVMGIDTLKLFFDSIEGPNDVYKKILLETLFAVIYEDEEYLKGKDI